MVEHKEPHKEPKDTDRKPAQVRELDNGHIIEDERFLKCPTSLSTKDRWTYGPGLFRCPKCAAPIARKPAS